MLDDFTAKTLAEAGALLGKGEISAVDAAKACLGRIRETEPTVQALVTVDEEGALARAGELDKAGPDPSKPLWGVPIVVKDVLATKGLRTTCGSRILENFTPFYDAHAVTLLKDAGAVVLAKANMDEFAMGSSTENSAFFPTRNPWDPARSPGGSSGGSAATVAARQCFASVGTDTGGSIRLPAGFCGVVGLKPTYGRVSRFGLVAYGSSLDQAGPFARTVEDAAVMLRAMAGFDPRDSTCSEAPVDDYAGAVREAEDLAGVRIGVPGQFFGHGISDEVRAGLEAALSAARGRGAEIVDVSLSMTDYAVAAYYIIAMAEASSNLARFDGVRYGYRAEGAEDLMDMYRLSRTRGFGDEVQRRIIVGTYVLSAGYYDAYYRKAAQVRRLIRRDFDRAFESCDVVAGPVCPTTAPKLGEMVDDPLQMYLMDVFTGSVNLAGLPGMSLPAGLGADSGLPVGLQLIGRPFGEAALLSAAAVLEESLEGIGEPAGLA